MSTSLASCLFRLLLGEEPCATRLDDVLHHRRKMMPPKLGVGPRLALLEQRGRIVLRTNIDVRLDLLKTLAILVELAYLLAGVGVVEMQKDKSNLPQTAGGCLQSGQPQAAGTYGS